MAWPSPPQQWQARTWQDSCHVTGVTESVFRRGGFTPFLQLANLICAIAPLGRSAPGGPGPTPQQPPTCRDAPPRTGVGTPTRAPAGANRTPGFQQRDADRRQGGEEGPHAGLRAQKRSRWTRRSPARSHDETRMAQVWRPLGRAPVIWSYGWAIRVGGPKSPVVTRRQGYVRPRCAAAEYPQAVRGPLPRGTGDVHRACGWT